MSRALNIILLAVFFCCVSLVYADGKQAPKQQLPYEFLQFKKRQTVSTGTGSVQATESVVQTVTSSVAATTTSIATIINTSAAVSSTVATATTSGGEDISNLPTSSSFGNSIYAGSATFVTPTASGSVSPLYPIQSSVNVTFQWQFTALSVRPVNLTINAVGPNSVTYNIATLDGTATQAVWHFSTQPTNTPFMNGYYKVQLYDQRGVSATYAPGWMSPCTSLSVALYSPDLDDSATTMSGYCPLCFYNRGTSLFNESFGPIAITLTIAILTTILFLVNALQH